VAKPSNPAPLVLATSYPAIVGAVLVELRSRAALTQAVVARRLGLVASTWSRIENGSSALIVDQLALAAEVLGIQPGEILKRADSAHVAIAKRGVRVELERLGPGVEQGLAVLDSAMLGAMVRESWELVPASPSR
jgi:transcriptional regulator with XRE-family HTH domain